MGAMKCAYCEVHDAVAGLGDGRMCVWCRARATVVRHGIAAGKSG